MIDEWLKEDTARRRREREGVRQDPTHFLRVYLAALGCAVLVTSLLWAIGNAHAETSIVAVRAPGEKPGKTITAVITAYTSSVDETDDTPFETASGARTSAGVLACPPGYAFGTQIKIGEATYTCRDRMNRRYWEVEHFDVWVHTKAEAREWGSTKREITIYE